MATSNKPLNITKAANSPITYVGLDIESSMPASLVQNYFDTLDQVKEFITQGHYRNGSHSATAAMRKANGQIAQMAWQGAGDVTEKNLKFDVESFAQSEVPEIRKMYTEGHAALKHMIDGTPSEEAIDTFKSFLKSLIEDGTSKEIMAWNATYDLPTLMVQMGQHFEADTELKGLLLRFEEVVKDGRFSLGEMSDPIQAFRLQLAKEAYSKPGLRDIVGAKFGVPVSALDPFDPQTIKAARKLGGWRVEHLSKFFDPGYVQTHTAGKDIRQSKAIFDEIQRFSLLHKQGKTSSIFDFAKQRASETAGDEAGIWTKLSKTGALESEEAFYRRGISNLINPVREVSAVSRGANSAVSKIVGHAGEGVSRVASSALKSNSVMKIIGASAIGLIGAAAVSKLFQNHSIDDRSNNIEALIGKNHKFFGVFGSGFRGRSDYLNEKIDDVKAKGGLLVGGSYVGLPDRELKQKLLSAAQAQSGDRIASNRKTSGKSAYSSTAAELGDTVHAMLQQEYQKTGASAERKFVNVQAGLYGSIDIVKGDVYVEVKTVNAGKFNVVVLSGKPYPQHVQQLNAYMGAMGKTHGKLVYVNQENLSQRIIFDITFGERLYKKTLSKIKRLQRSTAKELMRNGTNLGSLGGTPKIDKNSVSVESPEYLKHLYSTQLFKNLSTNRGMPGSIQQTRERRQVQSNKSKNPVRRETTFESLLHGFLGGQRKFDTDFGSGFRVKLGNWDPDDEAGTPKNVWVSRAIAGGLLVGGGIAYKKNPEKLYKVLRAIEEGSPMQILNTFKLSDRVESRVIAKKADELPNKLIGIAKEFLIKGDKNASIPNNLGPEHLTTIGKAWFERLGGTLPIGSNGALNLQYTGKGNFFRVVKKNNDVWEQVGEKWFEIANPENQLANQAFRLSQPVDKIDPLKRAAKAQEFIKKLPKQIKANLPFDFDTTWINYLTGPVGSTRRKVAEKIAAHFQAQTEKKMFALPNSKGTFAPVYEVSSNYGGIRRTATNMADRAGRTVLGGAERFNKLLSKFGLGAERGSYNTLITLPFRETLIKAGAKLTPGRKGLINQLLGKRYMPIVAGLGALGLADYLTGHVATNTPINAIANTRVGLAQIGRVTGLQKVKNTFEDVLPVKSWQMAAGIIAGTFLGFKVAPSIINAKKGAPGIRELASKIMEPKEFSKYKSFTRLGVLSDKGLKGIGKHGISDAYKSVEKIMSKKGLRYGILGALPFLALAAIPGKSPQELKDIYSGRKDVEIKKGRGWELSSTPFAGDRTKEFRKHWIARFTNRQWQKDEYGSEWAHWKYSLKTPIGWANLLFNPYGKELEAARRGRKFPLTEELFTDIPFIGSSLGRFVGHAIKPPKFMYANKAGIDKMADETNPDLAPSKKLGGTKMISQYPWSLRNVLGQTAQEYMTEAGLAGFVTQEFGFGKLWGNSHPFFDRGKPTLETANEIGSTSRWLYGLDLGGGAFTTEAIRRVIRKEPTALGKRLNPLPNDMPNWLAGVNDLNKLNYGDPYSKVGMNAEYLPGRAYNLANDLPANLKPEDYPDIHKYMITSKLQPYSKQLTRMYNSLQDSSDLTPYEQFRVSEARAQVQQIKKKEQFDDYRFGGNLARYRGTVADIEGENITFNEYPGKEFKLGSMSFDSADIVSKMVRDRNMSMDMAAARAATAQEAARSAIASSIRPGQSIQFAAEAYAPENLNKVDIAVLQQGSTLNKSLAQRFGLGEKHSGAIDQLMYNPLMSGIGTVSEQLSHGAFLPGVGKFMRTYSPEEKYAVEQAYGSKLKLWQNPIKSFVKPMVYGTYHGVANMTLPYNGISGSDDDYNSIEGLKGNYHRQFGVFGSGWRGGLAQLVDSTIDVYRLDHLKTRRLQRETRTEGNVPTSYLRNSQAEKFHYARPGIETNIGSSFSASDEGANTIEAFQHGWYGSQRSQHTPFGSGFLGTLIYASPTTGKSTLISSNPDLEMVDVDDLVTEKLGATDHADMSRKLSSMSEAEKAALEAEVDEIIDVKLSEGKTILSGQKRHIQKADAVFIRQDAAASHALNNSATRANKIPWTQEDWTRKTDEYVRLAHSSGKSPVFVRPTRADSGPGFLNDKTYVNRIKSILNKKRKLAKASARTTILQQTTTHTPTAPVVHTPSSASLPTTTPPPVPPRAATHLPSVGGGHTVQQAPHSGKWGLALAAGAAAVAGYWLLSGKPKERKKKEEINEYFDKLEYLKYTKLATEAQNVGDDKMAKFYMAKSRQTMIGVNPVTSEPEVVTQTVPKEERPYMAEFINEPNPAKREAIIRMAPDPEKRLLLGQWFRQKTHQDLTEPEDIAKMREYVRNEGYSQDVVDNAPRAIRMKYGPKISSDVMARYSEIYAFMKSHNMPVPQKNWIGWDAEVDANDLKLLYLKSQGEDIHEYDLWEDREQALHRKPYLKGSIKPMNTNFSSRNVINMMDHILSGNKMMTTKYSVTPSNESSINLQLSYNADTIIDDSAFNRAVSRNRKRQDPGYDEINAYMGTASY